MYSAMILLAEKILNTLSMVVQEGELTFLTVTEEHHLHRAQTHQYGKGT
jgi:hypothetical protein